MANTQSLRSQLVDILFAEADEHRTRLADVLANREDADEAFAEAAARVAELSGPALPESAARRRLAGVLNSVVRKVSAEKGRLPVTVGVCLDTPDVERQVLSFERSSRRASERWGEVVDAYKSLVGNDADRTEVAVMHRLFEVVRDGFDEDATTVVAAVVRRTGLSHRQVGSALHRIRSAVAERGLREARKTRQ